MDDPDIRESTAGPSAGPFGGPLLFSLAHPDDESFSCGGTIVKAVAAGAPVTVISATRGERGESAIPAITTPQTLAAVRDQELRTAMAGLGVTDVRFLGYWDSGMDGTPENDDPRAFVQAPQEDVVTRLVVQVRGLRPAVVITFGPEGGYGHPDHIAIHHATVDAVTQSAQAGYRPELGPPWTVDALYYTATPRDLLLKFAEKNEGPFRHLSMEARQRLGVREEDITTRIDITDRLRQKAAAVLAHASQVGDPTRFDLDAAGERRHWRMLDHEHFVRARLPWEPASGDLADPLLKLDQFP
ncbi:MAG: PIG-L family deacetylase [Chloroflexota bacterium]|nr:PIG-L family deacetylase [Chloroflexota bacterium]